MEAKWTPEFLMRRLEDANAINARLVELNVQYIRKIQELTEEADAVEDEAVEGHDRIRTLRDQVRDLEIALSEMTADRDGLRELLKESETKSASQAEEWEKEREDLEQWVEYWKEQGQIAVRDADHSVDYWKTEAERQGGIVRDLMIEKSDIMSSLEELSDELVEAYATLSKIKKEVSKNG